MSLLIMGITFDKTQATITHLQLNFEPLELRAKII